MELLRISIKELPLKWASVTFLALGTVVPFSLILRDLHELQMPFVRDWSHFLRPSNIPATDDELIKMVEDELFTISSKQVYPIESTDFGVMIRDSLESSTLGSFKTRINTLFCLSSRLALKDIDIPTIRRQYPNFMDLFVESESKNFKIKATADLLSDENLKNLLLISHNAKKFAIARELLYAKGYRITIPMSISVGILYSCWCFCYFTQKRIGRGPLSSFLIALFFAIISHYYLLRTYFIHEVFSLDQEAAQVDEDHRLGAIDYLESSIRLCKFLHSLENPSSSMECAFTPEGNCTQQRVSYTDRLRRMQSWEKPAKTV